MLLSAPLFWQPTVTLLVASTHQRRDVGSLLFHFVLAGLAPFRASIRCCRLGVSRPFFLRIWIRLEPHTFIGQACEVMFYCVDRQSARTLEPAIP